MKEKKKDLGRSVSKGALMRRTPGGRAAGRQKRYTQRDARGFDCGQTNPRARQGAVHAEDSQPITAGRSHAMSTRVVAADDHPLMLDAVGRLLSAEEDIEVVACCATGHEALAATRRLRPDILFLDLHMPDTDGLELIRTVSEELNGTRVIVFAEAVDEREALECLRLRVAGVVLKEMTPHLILQSVRKVAAGEVWVEKESFSRALELLLRREEGRQSLAVRLSDRETEVMTLCVQGLSNSEIAERLFVTEGTVKTHLHNVYRKLDLNSRAELVSFAHQNGLL